MTWEADLFAYLDDLEGEAGAVFDAERQIEVADRARAEYSSVDAAGRLMASVGSDVALRVTGLGALRGRLVRVATGWCLVESGQQEWIVRLAAISMMQGISPRSVPHDAWPVTAKLGLRSALRRISESQERCGLRMLDGAQYDVVPVRVGADFVEAVMGEQRELHLFTFEALAAVHTRR
ncbi:hypothetical protein [Nocardioides sp. Root140]|uniref:hypothetical protein n=1 Tax=Nocardioides sp. Root140 TaxID=1736460 RepID=UPI0006F7EDE5|nr:hypothetical protein [Nocardioides sp. Root140]KQY56253.1 hypothetical protein ASD30_07805 [Nocardioides sp. Root140]